MAHQVFCPNCQRVTDCQKKGKVKERQKWFCKICKRTFLETPTQDNNNTANEAIETTTLTNNKFTRVKETKIYLNNNIVSSINAEISSDEAEKILQMYVSATELDCNVVVEDGVKKVYFTANLGRKA
jgi:hypothetical protein